MPKSSVKVVPIGKKKCKPFLVEVMVFPPESGYRFKVFAERSCTPDADPIWKLVFDLYKVLPDKETQIVHVSFTTGTPVEKEAVERMVTDNVTPAQAQALITKVHPVVKKIEGKKQLTPQEKEEIRKVMSEAITAVDV